MHSKTLIGVTCRLESSTNFADHHIAVLLDLSLIKESFKLWLLFFEFFNFAHDLLSFLKLSLFSEFLSFFVINIDFLLDLINLLLCLFLLNSAHLRLTSLLSEMLWGCQRPIFSSGKTSLNFLIYLPNHDLKLIYKLVFIPFLIWLAVLTCHKLFF